MNYMVLHKCLKMHTLSYIELKRIHKNRITQTTTFYTLSSIFFIDYILLLKLQVVYSYYTHVKNGPLFVTQKLTSTTLHCLC